MSSLPTIDRECQKGVPRYGALPRISRIHKQHPAYHGRAGSVERSTAGSNTVDGLIVAHCIEIPKDFAVFGRIVLWLDPRGYPRSVQGVFEERYTRVDHNHLEMSVTVDDPKIYTKPFVLGTSKFVWVPSQESEEQICVPSEAISYVNLISIPVAGEKEQKNNKQK